MFLKHAPCDRCGSSDGKAEYDDGSTHCFVCKWHTGGDPLKRIKEAHAQRGKAERAPKPPDPKETSVLAPVAVKWLDKYYINDEEKKLFTWHPVQQRLIYREGDFYNARNFSGEGPKYISYGSKPYSIRGTGVQCVLCEDLLSGIRLARKTSSLTLHGSTLPLLYRLSGRLVNIWLDADKWLEAMKLSYQLNSIGIECRVIRTDKDPKEYTDDEIKEILG